MVCQVLIGNRYASAGEALNSAKRYFIENYPSICRNVPIHVCIAALRFVRTAGASGRAGLITD
ncbi:MAG: hypothetical protein QOE77_2221 [Blastocatellia bacterium]|jgi:hypothetical protein|nr:hypothetical protein [Blastocatellia bacterium]